jgi:hypothetical protein
VSTTLDQAAKFEAMQEFWIAGEKGNEAGVEAAIAKYIDCLGLTLLHSVIVDNNLQEGTALAELTAHARRCGIVGGMKQ